METIHTAKAHLEFWERQRDVDRFVYVIQGEDEGPIKVGKAKNVPARIRTLQTGYPYKLHPIVVVPGYSELEWQLQHRVSADRLEGEWFDGPGVVRFLVFANALAAYMIQAFQMTGKLPDFREFRDGWVAKGHPRSKAAVRFVDPAMLRPTERTPARRYLDEQDHRRYIARNARAEALDD